VLRDVALDPSLAKDAGAEVMDGILYHRVEVSDSIAPITLYVSSATGRIAKLHTWDNSYLLRDVDVEVFFEAWAANAQQIAYPQAVYVAYDGHIIHQDARTGVEINPPLDATIFDLPAGASPMYDAEAAKRGAASHQFHEMFEAAGITLDGPQALTNPIPIAQGVVQLQGGLHNVGIIEQSAGLVMLDAPVHDLRSKAVLAWAKTAYPNKPITHVIVTHFHEDHSGGVREMAAAGAKIVVGEASADLFRRALKATSTVYPDTLSGVQIDTKVIEIADEGVFTIEDATNPVRAYHVRSGHAADMLVAYTPNTQALWVTDIYGAQTPPSIIPMFIPNAKELHDSIVNVHKIPVSLLFSGHGAGSNTFAQFEQLIGVP
jgi:glyoxylase-like metal-dependent hydrolase (beta-lactamase superfamily II)